MEGAARTRVVALVVLLAVSVPLVVVAVAGNGGDEQESGELRVERSQQVPEMLIYITDESANTPGRTDGRRTVTVECLDENGNVVASQDDAWPMTQTDGNTLSPHAHVPVDPSKIGDVTSCRLVGTRPLLKAGVS